jgi:hypothetical protein
VKIIIQHKTITKGALPTKAMRDKAMANKAMTLKITRTKPNQTRPAAFNRSVKELTELILAP